MSKIIKDNNDNTVAKVHRIIIPDTVADAFTVKDVAKDELGSYAVDQSDLSVDERELLSQIYPVD